VSIFTDAASAFYKGEADFSAVVRGTSGLPSEILWAPAPGRTLRVAIPLEWRPLRLDILPFSYQSYCSQGFYYDREGKLRYFKNRAGTPNDEIQGDLFTLFGVNHVPPLGDPPKKVRPVFEGHTIWYHLQNNAD